MTLEITIELDNAAFADGGAEEVARILTDLATRLPDPLDQTGGKLSLHDANGNYCGSAEITEASQRPDRPCDPDCNRRTAGDSAECDCSRSR